MKLSGKPVDQTSISYVGAPSGALLGSVVNPISGVKVTGPGTTSIVANPHVASKLVSVGDPAITSLLSMPSAPSGGGGPAESRAGYYHIDDYGADPSGATLSDAALFAAREAMGEDPGVIVLGVGEYQFWKGLNTDWGTELGPKQGVTGQGTGLTKVEFKGPGSFIEIRNPTWTFMTASAPSGGVSGLYISGWSNVYSNSGAIRYGDINRMRIKDVHAVGFNRPGGFGLFGDNQISWSERADIEMSAEQCTTCFLFQGCMANDENIHDASSFDYSTYKLTFVVVANQNAFVLRSQTGGLRTSMNGVDLSLTGNCNNAPAGGTNTGAMMTVGVGNDDAASLTGQLKVNVETSGYSDGVCHKDFVMGDGPWWLIKSRVRATGVINLIPFSGANFRPGSAHPFCFSFAGLLNKSPTFGSSPSFQPLQLYSQARGRWGTSPTNAVQMIYVKNATGGTFRLNYAGTWTSPLAYNASVADVQAALNAISALTGKVTVSRGQPRYIDGYYAVESGYGVTFGGTLAETVVPVFTTDATSLTGTGVDVVVRNPGSPNKTLLVEVETGNIIMIDPPPGTYRLALTIGGLTENMGVDRDSPFGLNACDLWIKQPTTGGSVVLEGPWFPPNAYSGSTYNFQWFDGQEPVMNTGADVIDLIRLTTYNFNTWVGHHITKKSVTSVPSSPTSSGVLGQRAFDGTYEYVCVAPNTWKRSALSTW